MKDLTVLWISIYILGSLSCGVGAKVNCCAKENNPAVQSCHSSSQASSKSLPVKLFDLCCCSISAELPKSLENLKVNQVSFFSFLSLAVNHVLGLNIKPTFVGSSLSPPDEFLNRHFFQLVFPSHAPPLTA